MGWADLKQLYTAMKPLLSGRKNLSVLAFGSVQFHCVWKGVKASCLSFDKIRGWW